MSDAAARAVVLFKDDKGTKGDVVYGESFPKGGGAQPGLEKEKAEKVVSNQKTLQLGEIQVDEDHEMFEGQTRLKGMQVCMCVF